MLLLGFLARESLELASRFLRLLRHLPLRSTA